MIDVADVKESSVPVVVPARKALDQPWLFPTALAAIMVLGGALRLAASSGDLWLDEVWTLQDFVAKAKSPVDIFLKPEFHHDNNHWLNTLWMYAMGTEASWLMLRFFSVLTGTATVWVVGLIARRYGKLQGLTAALLAAVCFLLVEYGSEARGYGAAAFFGVLSFYLMDRFLKCRTWFSAAFTWLAIALGFLSHLTFVYVSVALGVWSLVHMVRESRPPKLVWNLLRLHAVPFVFVLTLYFLCVRGMTVGGAPEFKAFDVIAETIGWSLGSPLRNQGAAWMVMAVAAGVIWELYRLWKESSDDWVFYLTGILAAPALLLLYQHATTGLYALLPRHFIMCVPLLLILMARLLCRLADGNRLAKGCFALIVLSLCGVHITRAMNLVKLGRGQYVSAIYFIGKATHGPRITIGGDQNFRIEKMLEYYDRYLPAGKTVHFCRKGEGAERGLLWGPEFPEWILMQDATNAATVGEEFAIQPVQGGYELRRPPDAVWDASRYKLLKMSPYQGIAYEAGPDSPLYGLSGSYWFIYRLQH